MLELDCLIKFTNQKRFGFKFQEHFALKICIQNMILRSKVMHDLRPQNVQKANAGLKIEYGKGHIQRTSPTNSDLLDPLSPLVANMTSLLPRRLLFYVHFGLTPPSNLQFPLKKAPTNIQKAKSLNRSSHFLIHAGALNLSKVLTPHSSIYILR